MYSSRSNGNDFSIYLNNAGRILQFYRTETTYSLVSQPWVWLFALIHTVEYMYGYIKNHMNICTCVYMYYLSDRSSCEEKEKKTTEINEISIS